MSITIEPTTTVRVEANRYEEAGDGIPTFEATTHTWVLDGTHVEVTEYTSPDHDHHKVNIHTPQSLLAGNEACEVDALRLYRDTVAVQFGDVSVFVSLTEARALLGALGAVIDDVEASKRS